MFFPASKIIGAFLDPLNLVALLLLTGLLLRFVWRRAGRALIIAGLLLFFAGGLLPIGPYLLNDLEGRYERPETLPARVDGILVLGGAFVTGISAMRGEPALNENAERITTALMLARRYPQALVVFSGGEGALSPSGRTEAQDSAQFLAQLGFEDINAIYEDESRNTFENIHNSRDLLLPQAGETWLLVTSAYHMPRAMAVARAAGWEGIVPYPVDYRMAGAVSPLPRPFDVAGNFYNLQLALHEHLGILAYRITGKIHLPAS